MIKRFSVKNYRGFKDKIVLDLSKPGNYEYNSFAVRDGIVKDLLIYGPNGSGKSNIGFAMFDIVYHITQNNKQPNAFNNYTFANNGQPVEFEYVFYFDSADCIYAYSKTDKGALISESLKFGDTVIFNREGGDLHLNQDMFIVQGRAVEDLSAQANSVSVLSYLVGSYPLPANSLLLKIYQYVDKMLWFRCLDDTKYIGFESGNSYIEEYIINNGLVKDYEDFLLKASGQEFHFKTPSPGEQILFCVIDGNKIPFYEISSTGTHALQLLYFWLSKIDKASLVFVDEFDAFYHYELSVEVCRRLFSKDAQIILTSHNTALMSNGLLRPDCYYLIDGSQIKPIVDCTDKELREGHNLEKIYRGKGFRL